MTYTNERYKQLEKMGLIPKEHKWRNDIYLDVKKRIERSNLHSEILGITGWGEITDERIKYGCKVQAFKLIAGTWKASDVLR